VFVDFCLRFQDKLFSYYYLRHTFLGQQEKLHRLVLLHFKLLSSFFYSQILQVPHRKDAGTDTSLPWQIMMIIYRCLLWINSCQSLKFDCVSVIFNFVIYCKRGWVKISHFANATVKICNRLNVWNFRLLLRMPPVESEFDAHLRRSLSCVWARKNQKYNYINFIYCKNTALWQRISIVSGGSGMLFTQIYMG